MGLLSSLGKFVSSVNPINIALNPLKSARQIIEVVSGGKIAPSKIEKTIQIVEAVPVGATVGFLLGGVPGAVKGAIALPTLEATFQASPKISNIVQGAVKNILSGETQSKVGTTLGEFVEGTGTKEPDWYATARMLGLGAGLSVLVAGGTYLGYKLLGDKLEKESESPLGNSSNITPEGNIDTLPSESKAVVMPSDEGTPILPATETITTGAKKRRKRATKQQIPNVNQKVNILINNRATGLQMRKVFKLSHLSSKYGIR